MNKYIDLELALNELLRLYEEDCDRYGVEIPECFDYGRAREVLIDLPTINIVYCVECRYKDMELCPMYKLKNAGVLYPYDFCSYGERRDNE